MTTMRRNAHWFTGSPQEAEGRLRTRNALRRDGVRWVLVDGPGDDEVTVMPLHDAIDGEFIYRWEA